eukprot:COSAG04_NODE_280_length_18201_cov_5.871119_11_plen_53_part_00
MWPRWTAQPLSLSFGQKTQRERLHLQCEGDSAPTMYTLRAEHRTPLSGTDSE